jgi:hypothetical protein
MMSDVDNNEVSGSRPSLNTLLIAIVIALGVGVIVYMRS